MRDYDIAIIGLGPAGATLARLLPSHLKVVAFDLKSESPGSFVKCCGGLLAPDAQRLLSRFDLALPKSVLADPQIFSVKTIDMNSGIVRHYPRFYMNMKRHKFDLWLMSLIPDTVEVLENTSCREITRKDGLWVINRDVRAKYLVGADGANSIVRRTLCPDFKIRRYTAIQQSFPGRGDKSFLLSVFDPKITDCYAWGLNKNGQFVFGGAFPKRDSRKAFEELKRKMAHYGLDLKNPLLTEACLVNRPANPFQFCPTIGDSAFLIGEAAGFISPSSLEGISYAMNSALMLSKAFSSSSPAREYRRATREIALTLTLKLLKCPFMYSPILRKMIMKSGIMSIKRS
jgi:flavin-dependent dehydrogenase